MSEKWLKGSTGGSKPTQVVVKREYASGKKMNSDKPTMKDFLPKGIKRNK